MSVRNTRIHFEPVSKLSEGRHCLILHPMTERELRKLEGTIRTKMEEIRKQRVSLKDSGIGGLMNILKKTDEALYERILPEYKKMVADYNIFK
jgi:hypothetical protein